MSQEVAIKGNFQPVKILEVELSEPLPALSMRQNGRIYKRGFLLVRLHTAPLSFFEFATDHEEVPPAELATLVWQNCQAAIVEHLREDGLPEISELTPVGIPYTETPICLAPQEALRKDPPFISIVIPTRNRTDALELTLNSILQVDYPHYDIIIVDNDGKPGDTEQLIKSKFKNEPRVRYFYAPNAGAARARNLGITNTESDIIIFADDDVIVDKYWLWGILEGFSEDKVACVTGLTLPYEIETQTQNWFQQGGGFDRGYKKKVFDMKEHRPPNLFFPYTIGVVGTGANMAMRASALKDVGIFDPRFGPGSALYAGEENDLFLRIVLAGYKIVYQPRALARHIHRREYEAYRKRSYRYSLSMTAYITKHLISKPSRIPGFVMKVPYAIYLLLAPKSKQNVGKSANFPKEIKWLELRGLLAGPFAYIRQWWVTRNRDFTIFQEDDYVTHV